MKKMNKLFKGAIAIAAVASFSTTVAPAVNAATINTQYALSANQGSAYRTSNAIEVAHATGTYASAENNAIFEKRTWYSNGAYVHYIVGADNQGHYGKVFKVGEEGYQAWGAGDWANANAPVQIELAQTYSNAGFKQDYAAYVNLLRQRAIARGIPLTLDSSAYTGIKAHLWITNHVWGDHTDPYGYLASHGISKAQFAHDIKYGVNATNVDTDIGNSGTNKPSTPTNKKNVDVTYALHQKGGNWLGDVKNFGSGSNGFAGMPNKAHDYLYIKASHGSIKYRVHTTQAGWLPWVSKGNKKDTVNGVAGIKGHTIDGVQMYYTTPSGETYQQAYYRTQTTKRSGYLGVCADNGSVSGFDSWAGMFGEPLDRLQIDIDNQSNF